MSLWKFNDFEQELDFTDVDFIERIESAQEHMKEDLRDLPKEGKSSVILRAQIKVYDNYFDRLFGKDAHLQMFKTRSLSERIQAAVSLKRFEDAQSEEFYNETSKYQVKKGNRAQRRAKKNRENGPYRTTIKEVRD